MHKVIVAQIKMCILLKMHIEAECPLWRDFNIGILQSVTALNLNV